MTHYLIVAAAVLAAWTALAVPLGVVLGRRLRRAAPPAGRQPGAGGPCGGRSTPAA